MRLVRTNNKNVVVKQTPMTATYMVGSTKVFVDCIENYAEIGDNAYDIDQTLATQLYNHAGVNKAYIFVNPVSIDDDFIQCLIEMGYAELKK